jgi:CHAD domain-containing protein
MKSADADAVHDLRVKIRRLSQAQTVFQSSFGVKEHKGFRSRLKKLMTQAGAVRDCDITMKLASKSKWTSAALLSRVEAARQDAEQALHKSLRQWLNHNDNASRIAVTEPAIEGHERRALLSIGKKFFARGENAANGATPQELHKFRIATKKFRYALELFASIYGPGLNIWLERIKGVQSRLGEINDYETARHMVARLDSWDANGSDPNGTRKIVADLKKKQRAGVKEFRKLWTPEVAHDWKRSILPALRDPKAGLQAPGRKNATA